MKALWICPFRPFFFLTAFSAIFFIIIWVLGLNGFFPLPSTLHPFVWHAYSIYSATIFAAVAGFMLTAIPEFTSTQNPTTPRVLKCLVFVWILGRIAFQLIDFLSIFPAAFFDLSFLATIFYLTAPAIWQQTPRKHTSFLFLQIALFSAVLAFYMALVVSPDLALKMIRILCHLMMVLVILAMSRISMRLMNDVLIRQANIHTSYIARPPKRALAIVAILLLCISEFLAPQAEATLWLKIAAAAGVFHVLSDWHIGRAIFSRWTMMGYIAYFSIALGYLLEGFLPLFFDFAPLNIGLHLRTIAGLGLAILLVMCVAGRMHSGWGLDVRPWIIFAAIFIFAAALLREIYSFLGFSFLVASAIFWCAAFLLYLIFSSHLFLKRPDGKSGCDDSN